MWEKYLLSVMTKLMLHDKLSSLLKDIHYLIYTYSNRYK